MGRMWRWLARHQLIAHLIVTAVTVGMVFGLAYSRDREHEAKQAAHDECVQLWADRTAERALIIARARRDIDVADAELWRTVAVLFETPSPAVRAQLLVKVRARVDVTDRYETQLREHPVPPPPRLVCRFVY